MRFTRKLTLLYLAATLLMIGCLGRNAIPDKDMEKILAETIIRRSIINNTTGEGVHRGQGQDSIDYHSDILKKYGYTLQDFKYTVDVLAKRKSNPLDAILANVLNNIDGQAKIAQYRYDIAQSFDTSALAYFRDTLLFKNEFEHGKLTKLDTIKIYDTLLKQGVYDIEVKYSTMSDYRYPTKSMKYYFASKHQTPEIKTMWLSRSAKARKVSSEALIEGNGADSLIIYFEEASPSYVKDEVAKSLPEDTSYVEYLQIVYTPTLQTARREYLNSFFGDFIVDREFPAIKEQYTIDAYAPFKADTIVNWVDTLSVADSIMIVRIDSLSTATRAYYPLKPSRLIIESMQLDTLMLDTTYFIKPKGDF